MKTSLIILVVVSQVSVSFAQSTGVETRGGSGPSVKDGADQSRQQNEKAGNKQNMMGALMFAMAAERAAACMAMDFAACAMAALFAKLGSDSMKQAGNHKDAARSAAQTSLMSDGYGDNPYGYNDPATDLPLTNPKNPLNKDPNVAALAGNLNTLKPIYNPTTGKITLPDGKTFNASDSINSMVAGGIPNGAALGAMEAYKEGLKKVDAKYEKMNLGALTESTGYVEGGGSGRSTASETASADAGSGSGLRVNKIALTRDASQLAGLQKNFNGEPIGVAEDSIFLMMTRRYKMKEKQNSFFDVHGM